MEITQLKQVGKSEKYRIFLDDNFVCCLSLETMVKNNIKQGMQIELEHLVNLQYESEKILAFEKACEVLGRALKTESEMKKYLKSKGYFESVILYVCDKLKTYGYINDLEYAKEYVNNYSQTKGSKAMSFGLYQKGISKNIIESVLKNLNQEEAVIQIAHKYMKNKELTLKNKQSLYRYLLSKGFSYSETSKATNSVFSGEEV